MDKNTLNGLLLMFLVFLAFMWFTPKNDEQKQQKAQEPEVAAQTPVNTSVDSLTAQEREWLGNNIAENGSLTVAENGVRS